MWHVVRHDTRFTAIAAWQGSVIRSRPFANYGEARAWAKYVLAMLRRNSFCKAQANDYWHVA